MSRLLADARLELWCEALESGDFTKTVGRLCKYVQLDVDIKKTCFCVLGVALEVYWKLNPDELEFEKVYPDDGSWPYREYYEYRGETRYDFSCWLPQKVADWYGIRPMGQFVKPLTFGGKAHISCLDTLNDRKGWTFKALAGVIRSGRLERTI